jgi:hypothetical protein
MATLANPQAVTVLENATIGRDATAAIPAADGEASGSQTTLGFGTYQELTYEQVLTDHKQYENKNFGRYVYVAKRSQNILQPVSQQSLQFVPAEKGPKVSTDARKAFYAWLQTPEAGRVFEAAELAYLRRTTSEGAWVAACCSCVVM